VSRAWKYDKATRLWNPCEIPDEEAMNIAANYGPRGREIWQNNPDHDGMHYSDYFWREIDLRKDK